MAKRSDLRSPVTRAQLDQLFSNPESDIWDLAIWNNTVLEKFEKSLGSRKDSYEFLNDEQKLLCLVGSADGEIGNGGMGQLVFNQTEFLVDMQWAFEKMGCVFASQLFARELNKLANSDFFSSLRRTREKFENINILEKKNEAWEAFIQFCDELYSPTNDAMGDAVSQEYWDKREETLVTIRQYIKKNEDKFFKVLSDN